MLQEIEVGDHQGRGRGVAALAEVVERTDREEPCRRPAQHRARQQEYAVIDQRIDDADHGKAERLDAERRGCARRPTAWREPN